MATTCPRLRRPEAAAVPDSRVAGACGASPSARAGKQCAPALELERRHVPESRDRSGHWTRRRRRSCAPIIWAQHVAARRERLLSKYLEHRCSRPVRRLREVSERAWV